MKQQEFVEPKVTTVKIHNKAVLTSSVNRLRAKYLMKKIEFLFFLGFAIGDVESY